MTNTSSALNNVPQGSSELCKEFASPNNLSDCLYGTFSQSSSTKESAAFQRNRTMKPPDNKSSRAGRIPAALQAIFLASNGGAEVDVPPRNMGFKVFSRILGGKNKTQVYNRPSKNVQVSAPEVRQTMSFLRVHQILIFLEPHLILSSIQPSMAQVSPQDFLDAALELRGYPTERYTTINSGYSNMPTELQLVSYDTHILKMVIRNKDTHKVREILTCGISPNACNMYGESLIHKVCKSGQDKLLQIFLDCGADIQVSDGAGRTPMHDACYGSKPSFKTFELLLKADPYLIQMMDGSGTLPLEYVPKEQYGAWNSFLASILDIYWNPSGYSMNESPPPLALEKANSRPAEDPDHALSIELATFVSSGKMKPVDAVEAQMEAEETDDDETTLNDEDDDDYYDDEDEVAFDDAELAQLRNLTKFLVKAAY
jgi:hypothetical protein